MWHVVRDQQIPHAKFRMEESDGRKSRVRLIKIQETEIMTSFFFSYINGLKNQAGLKDPISDLTVSTEQLRF